MTSIALPDMASRKKGLIINLSSAAGSNPTPLLTVYSACKVSLLRKKQVMLFFGTHFLGSIIPLYENFICLLICEVFVGPITSN